MADDSSGGSFNWGQLLELALKYWGGQKDKKALEEADRDRRSDWEKGYWTTSSPYMSETINPFLNMIMGEQMRLYNGEREERGLGMLDLSNFLTGGKNPLTGLPNGGSGAPTGQGGPGVGPGSGGSGGGLGYTPPWMEPPAAPGTSDRFGARETGGRAAGAEGPGFGAGAGAGFGGEYYAGGPDDQGTAPPGSKGGEGLAAWLAAHPELVGAAGGAVGGAFGGPLGAGIGRKGATYLDELLRKMGIGGPTGGVEGEKLGGAGEPWLGGGWSGSGDMGKDGDMAYPGAKPLHYGPGEHELSAWMEAERRRAEAAKYGPAPTQDGRGYEFDPFGRNRGGVNFGGSDVDRISAGGGGFGKDSLDFWNMISPNLY